MPGDQIYNFSDKQLKFSYWYITNKLLLKKIGLFVLAIFCSSIWFYIAWQLAFFAFQYDIEDYNIRRLMFADNLGWSMVDPQKPVNLQITDPVLLPAEDGRNDYFVQVVNGNKSWLATFDYKFNDGGSSGVKSGFALPDEKKYLMGLGVGGGSGLDIANIGWQRVLNPAKVYDERFRFLIENEEFIAGAQLGDPNRLIFDVTNYSAYNYWQVGFQAFLFSGGSPVSINYITVSQFKSMEKRRVEINWHTRLPRITGTQIIPEVNVFDQSNIMPQNAEPENPIR